MENSLTAPRTAEQAFPQGVTGAFELVEGERVDMSPTTPDTTRCALNAARLLEAYSGPTRLGLTLLDPGFILHRDPDTVRIPDVAFVRAARVPANDRPGALIELAPDLAVLTIRPGDRAGGIENKVRDYLEAGTPLVLLLYPSWRRITAVRSIRERTEMEEAQDLATEDVLPGFRCRVADFFA